jgi:hypothetical protein
MATTLSANGNEAHHVTENPNHSLQIIKRRALNSLTSFVLYFILTKKRAERDFNA